MAASRQSFFTSDEYVQRWLEKVQVPGDQPDKRMHRYRADNEVADDPARTRRQRRESENAIQRVWSPASGPLVCEVSANFSATAGNFEPHDHDRYLRHRSDYRRRKGTVYSGQLDKDAHVRSAAEEQATQEGGKTGSAEAQMALDMCLQHEIEGPGISGFSSPSDKPSVLGDPGERSLRPRAEHNEDPSKKYARRPRHKPKPDKYDYKGYKRTKKHISPLKPKRKSQRTQRRKTGTALNHDFKAPNVEQERLTLKPNSGPGLFNKGKASEPVLSRGLPDLTFSEMTFLNKRRRLDDVRFRDIKDTKSAKEKTRGSAQEISSFFSRPPNDECPAFSSIETDRHRTARSNKSLMSRLRSSPAQFVTAKPLNIISGNTSGMQVRSVCNQYQHSSDKCGQLDENTPQLRRYEPPSKRDLSRSTPVDAVDSHISWSPTPNRIMADTGGGPEGNKVNLEHLKKARCLSAGRGSSLLREPLHAAQQESSVTDQSLDWYTKQTLLGKPHETWTDRARSPYETKLYSLGDLKGLARITELEESAEQLPLRPIPPEPPVVLAKPNIGVQDAVTARLAINSRSAGEQYRRRQPLASSELHISEPRYDVYKRMAPLPPSLLQLRSLAPSHPDPFQHGWVPTSENRGEEPSPLHLERRNSTAFAFQPGENLATFESSHWALPDANKTLWKLDSPNYQHYGLIESFKNEPVIKESASAHSAGMPELTGFGIPDRSAEYTAEYTADPSYYQHKEIFPPRIQTEMPKGNPDLDDFDAALIGRTRGPQRRRESKRHDRQVVMEQQMEPDDSEGFHYGLEDMHEQHHSYGIDMPQMEYRLASAQGQIDMRKVTRGDEQRLHGGLQTFPRMIPEHQQEFTGFLRPHLLY